jgi:predicted DNA-binding protein YlxM (UPF0122 family)|tara:strand:+ start:139 stop:324 length:186 start_codon:yes stop_codon:yes gene_type:complete
MTPRNFWEQIKISELASDLNVSRQAVYLWKKRPAGVPAERVNDVAQCLGVKKEQIRPDLFA